MVSHGARTLGHASLCGATVECVRHCQFGDPPFVVTMASQNLPGMAVIRASGYELPVSRLITMTGWASLVLAPFGAFALNFSAITAAICMGPEAHEDRLNRAIPQRRPVVLSIY